MIDFKEVLKHLTPTTLVEVAIDLYEANTDDPAVVRIYAETLDQGRALIGIEFAEMMIDAEAKR